ncbi:MAG: DNA polymerase IV [Bacteroidales bacterium]|nr:DNA polymerase IV [Bacteroidales bacterium]
MDRVIFHIDVNSAFLSWTAVQLLNQGSCLDIRTVPSVVSGDPSDRRSIVTAKSIPAKKYGINTAEPVSMAMRKCANLVVVRGDWEWYKKCSQAFIAICRTYSPVLEQFSIDECFLDMSGRLGTRKAEDVANELREDIGMRLGFTVNIGIGPNKLLAKMASDFEKPDKVHTLWSSEIEEKMWPLPVGDLLWVGKKSVEKLNHYFIRTIGQLAAAPLPMLENLFGQKAAISMHESANGIDESPVSTESSEAKSYSAERTFSKDISDPEALDRELFNVACIVAHRIRKDHFYASNVSVFVKSSDFVSRSKQKTMNSPTDVTALILNEARQLIPEIWDGHTPLRQVGLGVSKLSHDVELSLFEDEKMEFYRSWDSDYDSAMKANEKKDRHYRDGRSKALSFSYGDREKALRAAKASVKSEAGRRMQGSTLPDGTECFEVYDADGSVIEIHMIVTRLV